MDGIKSAANLCNDGKFGVADGLFMKYLRVDLRQNLIIRKVERIGPPHTRIYPPACGRVASDARYIQGWKYLLDRAMITTERLA
jgi:hypothetical protein